MAGRRVGRLMMSSPPGRLVKEHLYDYCMYVCPIWLSVSVMYVILHGHLRYGLMNLSTYLRNMAMESCRTLSSRSI